MFVADFLPTANGGKEYSCRWSQLYRGAGKHKKDNVVGPGGKQVNERATSEPPGGIVHLLVEGSFGGKESDL